MGSERKSWIFISLLILIFSITGCAGPDTTLTPPPIPFLAIAPRFIQPRCDIDGTSVFHGHNEIVRVFYKIASNGGDTVNVEYNVVFRDEDVPDSYRDEVYDGHRESYYGRVADIEKLIVSYDRNTWEVIRIEFPTTYSGEQSFFEAEVKHFSESIDTSTQVIYINTWNHLYAEHDTNPEMDKYSWNLEEIDDMLLYRCEKSIMADFVEGDRGDAEDWARTILP
jgi:hypothetical protein